MWFLQKVLLLSEAFTKNTKALDEIIPFLELKYFRKSS